MRSGMLTGGSANFIAFDNITLGSAIPGGVPELSTWAMMLIGFAGLGFAVRRSRRKVLFARDDIASSRSGAQVGTLISAA